MCGIAGIISQSGRPIEAVAIGDMLRPIIHRGPDGEGIYVDGTVGLGHRRLSIIDLSEDASQPMSYRDRYWVTFNGEIYNYIEIRDELVGLGHQFQSHSDTEVLLAAFAEWGRDCVTRFNGMWAFAIYDKEQKTVFLSRDRFGIKPLYYCQIADRFSFASEIKQLIGLLPSRRLNYGTAADYLIAGFWSTEGETFLEGISEVKPGHNIFVHTNPFRIREARYYRLQRTDDFRGISEADAIQLISDRLERSIQLRLRADVRVGTCLSGGQDSSTIAAIASRSYFDQTKSNFCAITAVSGDSKNDETEYARDVAENSPIEWHCFEYKQADWRALLDKVLWTQEVPFATPSIAMQYGLFELAKRTGCKVMLDGQGGDEVFVGYERYYPAYLSSLDIPGRASGFFQVVRNSKLTLPQLAGYSVYFRNPWIRKALLKMKQREYSAEIRSHFRWRRIPESGEYAPNLAELQIREIAVQLPHLLHYEDRNSMAHSIEARVPLIDYKLVEIMVSLPDALKVKNGWSKYLLRKASERVLSHHIVWRRNKVGFEPPSDSFLISTENVSTAKVDPRYQNIFSPSREDHCGLDWKKLIFVRWMQLFEIEC